MTPARSGELRVELGFDISQMLVIGALDQAVKFRTFCRAA
jgi:hypothetical protein